MAMTKADETFLKTLKEVVVANMQNPEFCLDDMASLLNMSRSSLNRKIKGNMAIIELRLQMFTQFQSIHLGHHNIRNNQIDRMFSQHFQRFYTIDGCQHLIFR